MTPRPLREPLTLVLTDLSVSLARHGRRAGILRSVSLRARPGTVHAIVGESGSGKSTLLRTVNRSLPPGSEVQGSAVLVGENGETAYVLGTTPPPRWRLSPTSALAGHVIGTVPQSAATALTPVRTFGDQLRETCRALDSDTDPNSLLPRVGLRPEDALLYPHELSGGMAQRAAFALAIAGTPSILLADEPTSALDPALTSVMLGLLRDHADAGGTAVLVTHDLEALEKSSIADDITVMHRGCAVEHAAAPALFTSPQHEYTRRLLAALPSRGLQVSA